jgi:hypothetical protein
VTIDPPLPPSEGPAPDPGAVGPTEPAAPWLPSPPSADIPEPTTTRRRWPVWLGIGTLVLVVVGIVLSAAARRSDILPDQVGQLHRLHTAQVEALEHQMSAIKVGDVKIDVASYGSDDKVDLTLFRYSNLPTTPQLDAILRGAAGGIIATGGTADFDAESVQTRNGIEYRCIPFTGRLFPDDPSDTSGQVCAWEEGGTIAVIMDARTAVAGDAAADAESAHEALA